MGLKLTKIRPVRVLAITASTTGLLVYSLGDYDAPAIIVYSTYLYSSLSLPMLQTTMLATFGGDKLMTAVMNGASGAVVVALILVMATYNLWKGVRRKYDYAE